MGAEGRGAVRPASRVIMRLTVGSVIIAGAPFPPITDGSSMPMALPLGAKGWRLAGGSAVVALIGMATPLPLAPAQTSLLWTPPLPSARPIASSCCACGGGDGEAIAAEGAGHGAQGRAAWVRG